MVVKKYSRIITFSLLFSINNNNVMAQIVPDNTLPTNSTVVDEGQIQKITNGSQVGNNLFHSFDAFSVGAGITAYFDNSLNIENIISRVTGASVSNINGAIQANGKANFFLINPRGIIFGPSANLNIGGSFLGSTASSIQFANGNKFSAVKPLESPLLSINVPIGLNFESLPRAIKVKGNGHSLKRAGIFSPILGIEETLGLQVKPGKTLMLVGGSLILEGGNLKVENGKIELASIESGFVSFENFFSSNLTLNYRFNPKFGNISLSQKSSVITYGIANNTIAINGKSIIVSDGSVIVNQSFGKQTDGIIDIKAADLLEVTGISQGNQFRSSLSSENLGEGKGLDLSITASQIRVNDGARLNTTTYGTGKGGNLILSSKNIQVSNVSPVNPEFFSDVVTQSVGLGKGGNLFIVADDLNLSGAGGIGTVTFNSGAGGNIEINISKKVRIIGFSLLNPIFNSNISSFGSRQGVAGNLTLTVPKLIIEDGGGIGSRTAGIGKGGNVLINSNSVSLSGVSPTTFSPSVIDASTFGPGDAGNLTINTSDLVVKNGGRVDTTTLASGNAGNLTINASNSVEVSGSVPGSVNPSLIDSSANILDENLRAIFELPEKPSGNSGSVTIGTKLLRVRDGGQISVRNDGTGNGGELQINANSIELKNQAGITASTQSGNGGNIKFESQNLLVRDNSITSAEAGNRGNGGNISINTGTIAVLNKSGISANAFQGNGGNIEIKTQGLFSSPKSEITASSTLGVNGTVDIQTLGFDVRNTITPLQNNLISPEQIIAGSCLARRNAERSSFVVTGSGGLPVNPYSEIEEWEISSQSQSTSFDSVQSEGNYQGMRSLLTTPSPKKWKLGDPIIEAQGIVRLPNGRVLLGMKPQRPASAESLICKS